MNTRQCRWVLMSVDECWWVLMSVDECWWVLRSVDECHTNTRQGCCVLMNVTWESNKPHICISYAQGCGSQNVCTLCAHSETHTHTHKHIHICDTQTTFLTTRAHCISLCLSLSHTHTRRHSVCRTPILSGPPSLTFIFQNSTGSHCVPHTHTHNSLYHSLSPPPTTPMSYGVHIVCYIYNYWRNT